MRRNHIIHGLLAASVCLFASSAAAQQSGFGEFLNKINAGLSSANQALSGQAPRPANQVTSTAGQNGGSIEILKKYAEDPVVVVKDACERLHRRQRADADWQRGMYLDAQAGYLSLATHAAKCAVGKQVTNRKFERISVAEGIRRVGSDLAMSAIAAKRANAVLPEIVRMAQDALNLLNTDPTANSELIAALMETGILGTAPPAIGSLANAVPMEASEAVKAYNGNTFGFKAKYNGKTLKVSGKIQLINGDTKQATVTLLGYMPPNPDNQGYQHQVRCEVMDQGALSRVMDLQVGKRVTVMGLFKPDSQSFPIGIELQNCIIAG
ncbi:MAG: hypothetical protein J0I74_08465 [Rhodanobacter sp.]|nr:hypothetical protein [Rhodanobacter sp.]